MIDNKLKYRLKKFNRNKLKENIKMKKEEIKMVLKGGLNLWVRNNKKMFEIWILRVK